MTPRPLAGMALVASASLMFAINGTVSKLILQSGVEARDLTTLRAIGACGGLVVLGLVLRPGWRRFQVHAAQLPLLIAYGLVGFFAVPLLYFVAIERMPVGIALLLEYLAPVLVALWARFVQGQRVKPQLWVGLALCLVGLAFVAQVWGGELSLNAVGVAAGLGAAVLLAAYFLLGAKGVASHDTISLTAWAFAVSAMAGLITRGLTGELPDWRAVGGVTDGGVPVWTLVGYLLICGTIVPYLFIAMALRHLPATSVGIMGMTEPVLASAMAWIALGERLSLGQVGGGLLLLVGVVLAETARVRAPRAAIGQNERHVVAPAPQRDRSPARA